MTTATTDVPSLMLAFMDASFGRSHERARRRQSAEMPELTIFAPTSVVLKVRQHATVPVLAEIVYIAKST